MISVDKVTVRFGGMALFSSVSFMIDKSDKIGLVGKNGAGKSTLLKVLLNEILPSEGNISMTRGIALGYLPQTLRVQDTDTLMDETRKAFDEELALEQKIVNLNNQLATREDYESEEYSKLIEELSVSNDRHALIAGGNRDAEIERILKGLGFQRSDFDRLTSEFSGGWRMRIELAKLLLRSPDVLLLDEPTNHLDIESIEWLEEYLKKYRGAIILISHDKRFLDNVTLRTVEIALGKIHDYRVAYSQYRILRKDRYEQELAAYKNQQKLIEETEQFIERFRYKATKSVQVQSRIKQLEKIDRIEVEEEDKASLQFRFQPAPRSGNVVVETHQVKKAYGDHVVLDNLEFELKRGEKVAFVGRNGEGKSTFAKAIVGVLQAEGEIKLGHNVSLGYYAQEQDKLMDEDKTVLDTLDSVAVGDIRTQLRDILGAFLFSGEAVEKKVKVLSGGERSRLALAKLLLQPYNLLVLDEPTNHLDMRSKDVLKKALLSYDGAIIVVSHDRDFLDGLLDTVYEFSNKNIKQHFGGVSNFLEKKKLDSFRDVEKQKSENRQVTKEKQESSDSGVDSNKLRYEARKELDKKLRKLKNELKTIETKIEENEELLSQTTEIMAQPSATDLTPEFFENYEHQKKIGEELMEKWEELTEEYETLVAERDEN